MSKERLGEIEAIEQEVANGFEIEDLNLNTMTVVNREHFEWLKEQAERFEVLSEQHDEALKQNKLYCEAISYVMGAKSSHYDNNLEHALDDIKFTINETLQRVGVD